MTHSMKGKINFGQLPISPLNKRKDRNKKILCYQQHIISLLACILKIRFEYKK